MSTNPPENVPTPPSLVIPEVHKRSWRLWAFAGLTLTAAAAFGAWKAGVDPRRGWARPETVLVTLPVDEGSLLAVVTENGSLESSNNATMRCQVEALIGLTGGAANQAGRQGMQGGGRQGGQQGQGGQQAQGGQQGQGGQQAQGGQQGQGAQPPPANAKMKMRAGSRAGAAVKKGAATKSGPAQDASGGAGGANAGGSGGGAGGGAAGGGGGAQGGAGGAGGAGGGGGAAGATGAAKPTKPIIRSFTYQVPPYVSQKPKPANAPQQAKNQPMDMGGGGGGGGRRGGGGGGGPQEKPGSTRIIMILPEGTRVTAGTVVCELDSAAFRDELQAQQIRCAQAKAIVEQAAAILEVNEITLKEYRDGIHPQDVQLIRQYIATCRVEAGRAQKNLEWSQDTARKGYRSPSQVTADRLAYDQARIALSEAQGMAVRLDKFTASRLLKNLEAKIEAIRADKLSQQASYQLEDERLRRLQTMIERCTLRAPRDGIVVYANQSNPWGQVQTQIQEGVTVREGQMLVNLPDPQHMRVRAKVNESKVSQIYQGQKAEIRIDAFPTRPLMGTVSEVTPIPAPSNGPMSDVRVYFAMVEIDAGGFDELRPGLSAEVSFLVAAPRKVTRVPLQAVRYVGNTPYVAVSTGRPQPDGGPAKPSWQWRSLALGQSDPAYAEVVSGLKPGDRVVARPHLLPAPRPTAAVASAPGTPRG